MFFWCTISSINMLYTSKHVFISLMKSYEILWNVVFQKLTWRIDAIWRLGLWWMNVSTCGAAIHCGFSRETMDGWNESPGNPWLLLAEVFVCPNFVTRPFVDTTRQVLEHNWTRQGFSKLHGSNWEHPNLHGLLLRLPRYQCCSTPLLWLETWCSNKNIQKL